MIFAAIVVGGGIFVVLAFNPVMSLIERVNVRVARRRATARLEMRTRIALARITHVYSAAQQAMWDESLDSVRSRLSH